jgi:hypothetical protein
MAQPAVVSREINGCVTANGLRLAAVQAKLGVAARFSEEIYDM